MSDVKNKLSAGSLLQAAQSRRVAHEKFILQVAGFEGGMMFGVRTDTGESVKVELAEMKSPENAEPVADQRRTVYELAEGGSKSVKPGGFVRIDGAYIKGDVYKASYLKRLTCGPGDADHTFITAMAKPFSPIWRGDAGMNKAFAAVDLLFNDDVVMAKGKEQVSQAIISQMLRMNADANYSRIGTGFVLVREPGGENYLEMPKVYAVSDSQGGYRMPTADEIMTVLRTGKKDQYRRLMDVLSAEGHEETEFEIVPGVHCRVGSDTAASSGYLTIVRKLYQESFKNSQQEDGQTRWYSMYRESIISFARYKNGQDFFVSDISATLADRPSKSGRPNFNTVQDAVSQLQQTAGQQQANEPPPPATETQVKQAVAPAPTFNQPAPVQGAAPTLDENKTDVVTEAIDINDTDLSSLVDLDSLPEADPGLAGHL